MTNLLVKVFQGRKCQWGIVIGGRKKERGRKKEKERKKDASDV